MRYELKKVPFWDTGTPNTHAADIDGGRIVQIVGLPKEGHRSVIALVLIEYPE